MAEFKYQTREDLVRAVRRQNPNLSPFKTDDQVYDDFIQQYPEFINKVAENITQNENFEIDTSYTEGNEPDKKTGFTAIKELFSRDFYKYVPFVRDAEIAESYSMMKRADRVIDGTASEEDIIKVKEFALDNQREKTFMYGTLDLLFNIPAYATEFGLVPVIAGMFTGGVGGVAAAGKAGAGRVALATAKAQAKKSISKATEKILGAKNLTKIANTTEKVGESFKPLTDVLGYVPKKVAGRLDKVNTRVAQRNFATKVRNARLKFAGAEKGAVAKYINEEGIDKVSKRIGKTILEGAEEAGVMALWRSPQAMNKAFQQMSPVFVTEDGVLNEELVLRLVDEGDDFGEALAKGYADLGIEFFSEKVGDSLYLINRLMGGEMVQASAKKFIQGATPQALSDWYQNVALKSAIVQHMTKVKDNVAVQDMLFRMGWSGTLAEMYEERVGDVLRASVGLQDHWLPEPEQLAQEALAFTLFGFGAGVAHTGMKSKVLGGAGYESAQRARDFVNPGEGKVLVQNDETKELDQYVDDIVDDAIDTAENPSTIVNLLRKFKIKNFQPFANLEVRGGISQVIQALSGRSLDIELQKSIKAGKSKEQLKEQAREFLIDAAKFTGVAVRNSEQAKARLEDAIKNGEAKFFRNEFGFYVLDTQKIRERYEKEGRLDEFLKLQEESKQDKTLLDMSLEEYKSLNEQGLIHGEEITDLLDSKEEPSILDIQKLFNLKNPAQAKRAFELLKTARKSLVKQGKEDIVFKLMPNIQISTTGEKLAELGYEAGTEGQAVKVYPAGTNQLSPEGIVEVNISGLAGAHTVIEEVIEGVIRRETAMETNQETFKNTSPELSFLYDLLEQAARAAGINTNQNEADGKVGYNPIEIISKSIIGGLFGNYVGQDQNKFNEITLTENEKETIKEIVQRLLGKDLYQAAETYAAEQVEERKKVEQKIKEAIDEADKPKEKDVESEEQETTEESEKVAPKFKQTIEKLKTPGQKSIEDVESVLAEAQELINQMPEGEARGQAQDLLNSIQGVLESGDTISSSIDAAFDILNNSDMSFDLIIVPEEISSETDIITQASINANDHDHMARFWNEINSTVLSRLINRSFLGIKEATNHYYTLFKRDPETREFIKQLVENEEAFAAFVNSEPPVKLQILHNAIKKMINESDYLDIKAAHDMLKHIFNRYTNSHSVTHVEVQQDGTIKLLNKSWSPENHQKQIRTHITKQFGDNTKAELLRLQDVVNNILKDNANINQRTASAILSTFSGISPDVWNSMPLSKDFGQYIRGLKQYIELALTQNTTMAIETLVNFFSGNLKFDLLGNGFKHNLIHQLLMAGGIDAPKTIVFTNTEGKKELSLRLDSQLVKVAYELAQENNIVFREEDLDIEDVLASINGIVDEVGNKKGHKNITGEQRRKALLDLFLQSGETYFQSTGMMGGKTQVYAIQMPKIRGDKFEEALAMYKKIYANAKNASEFLVSPAVLEKQMGIYKRTNDQNLLFEINYTINSARINEKIHGNYSSYKNKKDLLKRSHQISTPGLPLTNIKNIKAIVIDDADLMDGQGVFSNDFGTKAAEILGPVFMNGAPSAASLKPNARYVIDGVVYQIKGSFVNSSNLKGGIHEKLNDILRITGADIIIPKSAAKLGFDASSITIQEIESLDLTEATNIDKLKALPINNISGRNFNIVQNLAYSTQFGEGNVARQLVTDMYLGRNQAAVHKIIAENTELLLKLIDEKFDIIFGSKALSVREELASTGTMVDLNDLSQEAKTLIDKIARVLVPGGKPTNDNKEAVRDLLIVTQRVLKDHAWIDQLDADYFLQVQQALLSGVKETDPQISQVVEQIKAQFLQRAIQRSAPRVLMQKVSSYGYNIPSYQNVDGKVRLAWIISNTPGVRVAGNLNSQGLVFESKQQAIDHIKANAQEYEDMFEINENGERTGNVKEHEIYSAEELKSMGIDQFNEGFVIPGGYILESRIPAENLQSHGAHRLWRKATTNGRENFSMSPADISINKGEDFDGDIGYQHFLYKNPKSKIEENRNKVLKLYINTYEDPLIQDVIKDLQADPEVFKDIADTQEQTKREPFANTIAFEIESFEDNRTSQAALGIVASNNKFLSMLEYLGYNLTTEISYGLNNVKFNSKGTNTNMPNAVLRKFGWGTSLLNIAVDNASAQQMAPLGLNDINISIAQILLFFNNTLTTKEDIKTEFAKIVKFLKSSIMIDYVNAIREFRNLPSAEKKMGQKRYITDYLKNRRHNSSNIAQVITLYEIAQEISEGNKLINTEFDPPKSFGDVIKRREMLNKLKNNELQNIKINNIDKDTILAPMENSVNIMSSKVFDQNIFSGLIGQTEILDKIKPAFNNRKNEYINILEKQGLQKLAELAINNGEFLTDKQKFDLYNVLRNELLELSNNPMYKDNVFLRLLDVDVYGRIGVAEGFQKINDLLYESLESFKEAFEALPEEFQDKLIKYQINTYGMSSSTWDGGFIAFISNNKRKELSEKVDLYIQAFRNNINDNANVQDQAPGYAKAQAYLIELLELPYTEFFNLNKPYVRQTKNEFNSDVLREEIIQRSIGTISKDEANNIKKATLKTEIKDVDQQIKTVFTEAELNEINAVNGADLNHSLLTWHQAVTYASPITFGGASSAHKKFLELINNADTNRILGRLLREKWEYNVGARRQLGKGAKKITDQEIERGKQLLSAIAAKLSGVEEVVLGVETVELPIEEAVNYMMKLYSQRYGDAMNGKPSFNNLRKATQLMKDGKAKTRKIGSLRDALMVITEAEMREYMDISKKKTIPVRQVITTTDTASMIYKDYNSKKQQWMSTAEEIEKEIRDAYEEARNTFNSEAGLYIDSIGKINNYVPLKYAVHPYLKVVLDKRKEEDPDAAKTKRFRGDVRAAERGKTIQTHADMVRNGFIPLTTNPAELFEMYTRETSRDRYLKAAWQMMLMSNLPDQSMMVLPVLNVQENIAAEFLPQEFLAAYAEKLQFAYNNRLPRNKGESALSYIERVTQDTSITSAFVIKETGVAQMPRVYVLPDQTSNVADMIIGNKIENKWLQRWETIVAWTKFAAIGFPYLSWFHHLALLESNIAIGGIQGSTAYKPRQHYLDFQSFRNNLKQDPLIARKWYKGGMRATLEDPDYAQGLVNGQLEAMADYLGRTLGGSSSRAVRRFLEFKKNWDYKLWVQLHAPLKIWTAEGLLLDAKADWSTKNAQREAQGLPALPWNETQVISEIAELVDSLYGGVNFQRRLWATPQALQIANSVSFAFDWTYAAASMAGAGAFPGLNEVFGTPTDLQQEIRLKKYIPAFYGLVMFAIPNAIQAAIYAVTRPIGTDDDEPLTILNENGRATWIDVTPLYRVMPFYDSKQYGTESEQRRVYLRWGKQGYEIGGWLTNPIRTAGYKLSVPLKQAIEQITGRSMGGWDLAYKNADYYGVFEAAGSFWNSRFASGLKMFTPFSVQDIINGRPTPLPGIPINFAKMKQGKHQWYAAKELSELYIGYTKQGNFERLQDHKTNIYRIGADIVAAAVKNGADGVKVQKQGLANARAELYKELENAMKKKKYDKANKIAVRLRALEASAYTIRKIVKDSL